MLRNHTLKSAVLVASLLIGSYKVYGGSPSNWTGTLNELMKINENWDNDVPNSGIAVFNGNADNAPLANATPNLDFEEMQFTADTQVSVITTIQTSGAVAVRANPGVMATLSIVEHQPLVFDPAKIINSGAAGDGGGTILYNLEAYGQLYANSGSTGSTIVNVTMTGGNNYFEVNGPGSSVFDNVSSDDVTDDIFISTGSNLTIRGSGINAISAEISGDGSLTKTGTGTLIFNSTNTYTGNTLVSGGILEVNGSLPGNVSVEVDAFLKGAGSIGGTLTLSGVIAPGNSIGILNVADFVSTSSSVFDCEINSAGLSDQIIATGSMSIAGSLNVIPLDFSFSSAKSYTIMQAGTGITGTFSSIQSTIPGLFSLNYGANAVTLNYLPFSVIGLTSNETAAANCFSTLTSADAQALASELFSLPYSQIQKAFNHMQPSQFSAQTWTQLANTLLVRSSYSKQLKEFSFRQACSNELHSDVWIDAIGQWQQQHGKDEQFGFNDWTAGFSLGSDTSYKQFRFGGAFSYTYSSVHIDDAAGNNQINSYYGGFYGGWTDDVGYVIFSTLGGYSKYKSARNITIGNIQRTATGHHSGFETLVGLEGGADFKTTHFKVGPFGRIDYVYLWQQGYNEIGANSLNLHVDSRHDQLLQSEIGVAFSSIFTCTAEKNSGKILPRLELSYINQTPLGRTDYEAFFQNSSCQFSVSGWNFERNLGAVGVALTYLSQSERFGVSLQYDGEFGARYSNQTGNLLFNIKF